MTTRLGNLGITKVALCGKGINPEAEVLLFKSKAAEPPTNKEAAPVADEISKADLDAVTAERDALKAELDTHAGMDKETLAVLTGLEVAKAAEDEVLKALPPEVRERIEKAEKDAADNAARIAKMEQDRRVESFIDVAKAEYAKVGDAAAIGKALEEVERTAPDAYEAITTALKAASERIDMSTVLREVGGTGSEAKSKLDDAVAEIQKAAPDLPRDRAVAKALKADPTLADEWQSATAK